MWDDSIEMVIQYTSFLLDLILHHNTVQTKILVKVIEDILHRNNKYYIQFRNFNNNFQFLLVTRFIPSKFPSIPETVSHSLAGPANNSQFISLYSPAKSVSDLNSSTDSEICLTC